MREERWESGRPGGEPRGRRRFRPSGSPFWSGFASADPEPDYEAVLERALRGLQERMATHDAERADAARMYDRLFDVPRPQRRLLLLNLPRDRSWSLADRLIQGGRSWGRADCRLAVEHAELATWLTARLSVEHYGVSLVAEIRARAWACLGTASRIEGRLGRADEAFAQAHLHLRAGTGEPLEEALLLDQEASQHATRRRFLRSRALLQRAAWLFQLVRDDHLAARARLKMGVVGVLQERWDLARADLLASVPRIDPARDVYCAVVGHVLAAAVRLRGRPWLTERAQAIADLVAARRLMSRPGAGPTRGLLERVLRKAVNEGAADFATPSLLETWPRWL